MDEKRDTEDLLRALAGYACSRCGKGLSEKNGYGCCEAAHCPLCGALALGHRGCEHLVATRTGRLALMCGKGGEFAFPAPPRWAQWNQCVWSDAQLRAAYGDVYGLAETVFGNDFTVWSKKNFRQWLMDNMLHPDICTSVRCGKRWESYWFSRDPVPDAKQVFERLSALRHGNAVLHRLEPDGVEVMAEVAVLQGEADGGATGAV